MTTQTKITLIGWAGFILFMVLFLQRCGKGVSGDSKTTHDTITTLKYDSITKVIKVKSPRMIDSFIVSVPSVVDTAFILQQYFNQFYFSQTVRDTNLSATITDTISKNKIIGRGFNYKWLKPLSQTSIINTTTIELPKRALYIGAFIGSNITGTSVNVGPQISFITKKNTLYTSGYDLLKKQILVGAQIKLGKKK